MAKKKRPTDIVERAVYIAQMATGEVKEPDPDYGKNPAAVSLGRLGGQARTKKLSAKKRKQIAKKAAKKRWKK